MKNLYLECSSGISGDMTVATLLSLGADRKKLESIINGMKLGCELKFGHVEKNGIYAYDFDVIIKDELQETERGLREIYEIIDKSDLPLPARFKAKEIFEIVAKAEARVHGLPIDSVHFHEVGAVDSIVDICAVTFCMYDLKVDRVVTSPLTEGSGQIKCSHGVIPVPCPATLQICRDRDIPLKITDIQGEMVTPTGAAIVAAYSEGFKKPETMIVEQIGYGAGKRTFPNANVLRGIIYKEASNETTEKNRDSVIVIETNIDDSSAEEMGYALEQLLKAGVKDVFFTPIVMKKSRPAYSLTAMCKPEVFDEAVRIIFENTSSVGLRYRTADRIIMDREKTEVTTAYGVVHANRFSYGDFSKISLEYDSVKKLAEEKGVGITRIYKDYNSD